MAFTLVGPRSLRVPPTRSSTSRARREDLPVGAGLGFQDGFSEYKFSRVAPGPTVKRRLRGRAGVARGSRRGQRLDLDRLGGDPQQLRLSMWTATVGHAGRKRTAALPPGLMTFSRWAISASRRPAGCSALEHAHRAHRPVAEQEERSRGGAGRSAGLFLSSVLVCGRASPVMWWPRRRRFGPDRPGWSCR